MGKKVFAILMACVLCLTCLVGCKTDKKDGEPLPTSSAVVKEDVPEADESAALADVGVETNADAGKGNIGKANTDKATDKAADADAGSEATVDAEADSAEQQTASEEL